jgi:hypothetical protein
MGKEKALAPSMALLPRMGKYTLFLIKAIRAIAPIG